MTTCCNGPYSIVRCRRMFLATNANNETDTPLKYWQSFAVSRKFWKGFKKYLYFKHFHLYREESTN
jgi:hypothetical protein